MKTAIIINFMPHYRDGFYKELISDSSLDITIFCHEPDIESRLKSIHKKYIKNVKIVKKISLGKETLIFSFLPFLKILRNYDVLVVEGNPRYLSHFIISTLANLLNKPILLWAMAKSISEKQNRITTKIRLSWMSCFKNLLVYTEWEKSFLKNLGFNTNNITGICNGLDQKVIDQISSNFDSEKLNKWKSELFGSDKRIFLSCARIESKNKFELLIEPLSNIVKVHKNVIWVLIGDGPNRKKISDLSKKYNLEENVHFVGNLHSEKELAPWFLSAEALIHPGAIGLSILHAFGYGLPVITHNNIKNHAPEFVAFKEGITGLTFIENSKKDLHQKMNMIINRKVIFQGSKIKDIPRNHYNTSIMADKFKEALLISTKSNKH